MVIRTLALIAMVRLALWVMPFRTARAMVAWMARRRTRATVGRTLSAEQLCAMIGRLGDHVPRATCLTQALVAQLVLCRSGFDPVLRLGVGRDERNVFRAHAWVECDGRVVIGQTNEFERFTPLPPLEQPASISSGSPAEGVLR
jgi:hypothetical protein